MHIICLYIFSSRILFSWIWKSYPCFLIYFYLFEVLFEEPLSTRDSRGATETNRWAEAAETSLFWEAAETSSPMQGRAVARAKCAKFPQDILNESYEDFGSCYSFSRKFHENLNGQIRSNSQSYLTFHQVISTKVVFSLDLWDLEKQPEKFYRKKSPGTWRQRLRSRAWRLPERRRVRARNGMAQWPMGWSVTDGLRCGFTPKTPKTHQISSFLGETSRFFGGWLISFWRCWHWWIVWDPFWKMHPFPTDSPSWFMLKKKLRAEIPGRCNAPEQLEFGLMDHLDL